MAKIFCDWCPEVNRNEATLFYRYRGYKTSEFLLRRAFCQECENIIIVAGGLESVAPSFRIEITREEYISECQIAEVMES